jgi:hypothetical protein
MGEEWQTAEWVCSTFAKLDEDQRDLSIGIPWASVLGIEPRSTTRSLLSDVKARVGRILYTNALDLRDVDICMIQCDV